MKTRYLFPYRYKIFGWIIFGIGIILGIVLSISDFDYPDWQIRVFPLIAEKEGMFTRNEPLVWGNNNVADEVASILIIVGGILVAFCKLQNEDEYSSKIRMESLIWATYLNYFVLVLSILFIFDMPFFLVIVYNMFTILIFFILRFHFVLYKTKKMLSHEE